MSKVIAVDVDLTVVRSDIAWYEYLLGPLGVGLAEKAHKVMVDEHGRTYEDYHLPSISYNLAKDLFSVTENSLEFWDKSDLYDELEPIEHSVEALRILKSAGYEIVFVTKMFGGHYDSKIRFINKHFPFHDGIIGTDTKHHIKCDYIIDDRIDNLTNIENAVKIVYNTPYDQGIANEFYRELINARIEQFNIGVYIMTNNWGDICNLILTGKV